jgi:hypothetical protein
MWIQRTQATWSLAICLFACAACEARSGLPIGRAAVSVRGRVGPKDFDMMFGRLACEHVGWISIHDTEGNVLVFVPQDWKLVVGEHTIDARVPGLTLSDIAASSGWINGPWGASAPVLVGRTRITSISQTEVSGQLDWIVGYPRDAARLRVIGAFRARRGCP